MGFVVGGVHTPRRILADAFASSCLTVNGFAHTMGLIIPVIAIFCGKKIQIERSSYEPSFDCVKCCARRRDPGGAAGAASGHCTESIIRRESAGCRTGLDAATP